MIGTDLARVVLNIHVLELFEWVGEICHIRQVNSSLLRTTGP